METYLNLGGNSGVRFFKIGDTSITVVFSDGMAYLYTYESTGSTLIEEMKRLARHGQGLNSLISRVVKKRFARKWRV